MDAGSTTVKGVVLNSDGEMLYSKYLPSKGNPVEIIKAFLEEVYAINPDLDVASSAVTGYGEDIIRNAFDVDYGIVETIAHFTAAKYFMPDVEFIIDIGGQDIKCFKIHNGAIDNIFLNEACSSGCGSFLQTFLKARSVRKASRRPRLALHGIHEFKRQAGSEGRRDHRGHLGRSVAERCQERII